MRIAHIVCTFPPYFGGMGNVAFEMASGLLARGHEVVVYTPFYGEFHEQEYGFARRVQPTFRYGNAARLAKIQKELEDFDIVHLHYPFFGTANLVRKWKLKFPHKPLVISYHMDTRASGVKGFIFALYAKFWMPKVLGAADAIIGSTLDYIEHSDARKEYEAQKQKWVEIPFGVNSERFFPQQKPASLFSRYNLDISAPTIVFVGGMDRPHEFKGIPVLLSALSRLKSVIPNIQAVLVGDGELRSKYELMAKVMRLSDHVRFVGRVSNDELPVHYTMGDIFILPSIHQGEAFGMVLLEAMSSGVPVIASDIAGVRSIALLAGTTFPPKNADALAQSIAEYFELSKDKQEEWRKNAREVVLEKFSWESVLDAIEGLYTDLVGKK